MYTEKHDEIESIVGALVTTVLNVCIVIAALKFRTRAKPVDMTTPSARLAFAAGIAAVLIGGKTIRSTDSHQARTDESDPSRAISSADSMHPAVFAAFDRICSARTCGGDVLEIGAVPSEDTLLCMPSLRGARRRIGVNIDGPSSICGIEILRANANDLSGLDGFGDESFDTVLCNAVLEHDPHFWMTLAEMRRLIRPGGLIGIGVPGFAKLAVERRVSRVARMLSRVGVPARALDPWRASTMTLQIHNYPGDYYRFSPQAMTEVFLEGLVDTEVQAVLVPPRIIGFGVKPAR